VREIDRCRHERALFVDFALGAGVAEHHTLVAGAFLLAVLLLLCVDTHGDIGRLPVQQHLDVGAVEGKSILVVTDVLDDGARGFRDQFAVHHRFLAVLTKQRRLPATFAGNHDLVGGAQGFAAEAGVDLALVSNAELDVVLEKRIKHRVGNLIADLVRVPFRHRLAREQVV
jgi:hypothetical protein